jgi:hypothetical protein
MARPLDEISNMPQMSAAFSGWMSKITLRIITQSVVDGLVEEDERSITFQGTIQPLSPQKTMLKPEGQRSWKWLQIHCLQGSLNLRTNDRIVYNNEIFKVMDILDYSLNNYVEYHAVKDYQDE